MYYTYLWLREDGTPYYVGKGKGRRGFINHRKRRVKVPLDINRIITQEFETEKDALFSEMFLISYFGREDLGLGCLLNLTDGGEGQSGMRHSIAAIEKIRNFQKLRKRTRKEPIPKSPKIMRMAVCHSNKKHAANGLCQTCYRRERDKITGRRSGTGIPKPFTPTCHPDRKGHAKGLCKSCYEKRRLERGSE